MKNQLVVVPGSLAHAAQAGLMSLEQAFMNARVLVLVDTSGSMEIKDSVGGNMRIDTADSELRRIQERYPAQVAVVSFSETAIFCPGGQAERQFGGTRMDRALEFAAPADLAGIPVVLISDGHPDDEQATLAVARTYKHKIDTVYVGKEGGSGQEFLRRLANMTGGTFSKSGTPGLLADPVMKLLAGGK